MTELISSSPLKKAPTVFKILIFAFVICLHASILQAEQKMLLDEIDPRETQFGMFNSFKYHLLLIALTQKNKPPFDCRPNRYIFYDYASEIYFEISAGNLKINSDYSKLILTKIHTAINIPETDNTEWKTTINSIMASMNVPAETLESGKSVSGDNAVYCWQQPVVMKLSDRSEQPFPFLAANLCKKAWCGELYWTDKDHVQFWAYINPNQLNLIQLNSYTGKFEYKKKSSRFFQKNNKQLNAPRDNLINDKNLNDGSFILSSNPRDQTRVIWKLENTKRLRIELLRSKKDEAAAERMRQKIVELTTQKNFTEALSLLKFGFWLNPDDIKLKYENLRVYASLLLVDTFFKYLEDEFSKEQRFSICKRLHIDPALKNIWSQSRFNNRFKQLCF